MVLDANRRQQGMTELTHLQQMDVFSTSRLDTCAVLFKLNFHKIFYFIIHIIMLIVWLLPCNFLLTWEIAKPRQCQVYQAIARSIQQNWGLRFSHREQMFEVNKLSTNVFFWFWFCKPVIGLWALQEDNALELANQSMCIISAINNY